MIYLQHGPSWKPKTDELLQKNLIQGIIWDPREEKTDRIIKIKEENKMYRQILNFVDLKWFYRQFPNSLMKRLEELDYFPDELIDRNYLRQTEEITKSIDKMIEFENIYQVDAYFSPTLYISSFNDRFVDRIFDINDIFYEKLENKKKYINLIIHEAAFDNETYMKEFINDISNYIGKYSGIYLVIDRDNTSTIRHGFSETRLAKVMQFIYSLKRMTFEVIVGYSGIESINYMAVGADAIATGWFYSLRRFNRLEKGLEEYSTMGRAKKRYLSINFLNELKIEEDIQMLPISEKDLYNIILNGNNIDDKIKNEGYEVIPMNDTYIQYFESMNYLSTKFENEENIENRINYLQELIDNAIKNTEVYNNNRNILSKLQSRHLYDYKKAIEIFRKENFI